MGGRTLEGPIGSVFMKLVQNSEIRGYGLGPGPDGLLRFVLHREYVPPNGDTGVTWSPMNEDWSLEAWVARMRHDPHPVHPTRPSHPCDPGLRHVDQAFSYVKAAVRSTNWLPKTEDQVVVPSFPSFTPPTAKWESSQLEQGFAYLKIPDAACDPENAPGYVFTTKVKGAPTAVEHWFLVDPAIRLVGGAPGFETREYRGTATVNDIGQALSFMNKQHWTASSVFSVVASNSLTSPIPGDIEL